MTEQKLQGSRSQPWPGPFPSPAAPSDTSAVVAQEPQCPQSHTMSRFRELTPKSPPQEAVPPGRTQCPWSEASETCYHRASKTPSRQKLPPGREYLISHTSYCSMQQPITQSQPQVWICGLEIRHGPSLLNASFTLTGCP